MMFKLKPTKSALVNASQLLAILSSLFWTCNLHAQTPTYNDSASSSIKLSIRTIQASEPESREESASATTQIATTEATETNRAVRIDQSLKDLEPKLAQLPFASFQLLSAKEEVIALKTKNSLQLPNGQILIFRPMYANQQKVGLWLNWRDRDGSEILNTRLHFDSTDVVLTGTDCPHKRGMILAIRALPLTN